MINLETQKHLMAWGVEHTAYILLGVLCIYYAIILAKRAYHYVNDVEHPDEVLVEFLLAPFVYGALLTIALLALTLAVALLQWLLLYITVTAFTVWGILYVARSVIRLNKKLDKHTSDKDAHKG